MKPEFTLIKWAAAFPLLSILNIQLSTGFAQNDAIGWLTDAGPIAMTGGFWSVLNVVQTPGAPARTGVRAFPEKL